jgi:hypothetical protein
MARRRGRGVIELEAPSFYREILLYPFEHGPGTPISRGVEALLVLLSQLATAAGAVREWLAPDEGWRGRARGGRVDSPRTPSAVP